MPEDYEKKEVAIQPLHFSRDFVHKLRTSLSLVGFEKAKTSARSMDDFEPMIHRDSLARSPTRTTSQDGLSNSGSVPKVGGKRSQDDEPYNYRPNTSSSGKSYASYTFGSPGFSTVASTSGIRAGGRPNVEVPERSRNDPLYRQYLPTLNDDEIGRAV
jgi:hypothetical protein